jgi:hypothetical protein
MTDEEKFLAELKPIKGVFPFRFACRVGRETMGQFVTWVQKYSLFCSLFRGTREQQDALRAQDGMIRGLFSSHPESTIVGIYKTNEASFRPEPGHEFDLQEILLEDDQGRVNTALRWNGARYEYFQRPPSPTRPA